jgi:hypothetical protein
MWRLSREINRQPLGQNPPKSSRKMPIGARTVGFALFRKGYVSADLGESPTKREETQLNPIPGDLTVRGNEEMATDLNDNATAAGDQ